MIMSEITDQQRLNMHIDAVITLRDELEAYRKKMEEHGIQQYDFSTFEAKEFWKRYGDLQDRYYQIGLLISSVMVDDHKTVIIYEV